MRNLKFMCAFNGAGYHGFQIQPNAKTIQGELEAALLRITGEKTTVTGCSRTDAGVHAREFCFNAFTKSNIPEENFPAALNAQLPPDIAVFSCRQADEKFSARFSAKSKEYVYLINNKKQRDVFLQSLAYHYPHKIDLQAMQNAAKLFIGEHDFAAFCKSEGLEIAKTTTREIYTFDVAENNSMIEFTIRGNAFLYNMVRIMAGTLLYVSEGKLTPADIEAAFETGERDKAGKTLPPCGLYLNRIFY